MVKKYGLILDLKTCDVVQLLLSFILPSLFYVNGGLHRYYTVDDPEWTITPLRTCKLSEDHPWKEINLSSDSSAKFNLRLLKRKSKTFRIDRKYDSVHWVKAKLSVQ